MPDWTLLSYRLMYRLGVMPWDNKLVPEEVIDLVEGPESLVPGRVLELGCGTGTHTVYLAQHGWQVTAVDLMPRAIEQAQRKAEAEGVHPRFVQGDVTRMDELGVGGDYDLILDVTCFHGLTMDQREATAKQITQASRPGSTFFLFGFQPGKRGPFPSGFSRDEVLRYFGDGWELLRARESTEVQLGGPLKNAHPTGYLLRRR